MAISLNKILGIKILHLHFASRVSKYPSLHLHLFYGSLVESEHKLVPDTEQSSL